MIFLLLALCSLPAWATFGTPTITSAACGSTSSCALTVPTTGFGHALELSIRSTNSSITIASVADNAGNNWYHPDGGGGNASATCAASDSTAGSIDCALVLISSAAATTVTATLSGASGGATATMYEVSYTAGPLGYELPYAFDRSSGATTQSGALLNLRGTNDFIIQGAQCSHTVSSIGGSYTISGNTAYLSNSTTGTAPTWTLSTSGVCAVSGFALAESFGVVAGMNNQWVAFSRGGGAQYTLQCFLPANVSVSGGYLNILSQTQTQSCDSIDLAQTSRSYTGGYVSMRNFSFLYGSVRVRAKFGGATGQEQWPAIWMNDAGCEASDPLGTDNNCNEQEIDIAEILNGGMTSLNQEIHVNGLTHNDGCSPAMTDASTNFHVYGLDWSAGVLVFSIDGVSTCTITQAYVPNAAMYVKLDTFVGYLNNAPSGLPWTMQVDYVQVTQAGTTVFYDDFLIPTPAAATAFSATAK